MTVTLRERAGTRLRGVVNRVARPAGYALVETSGRNATILPDDRMIVSYPRSGNTWVTFLLTNLAFPEAPTRFANLEERCPDIHGHPDSYLLGIERPRMLKSHEPFDGRYRRVLYLVRDPRDVAVSYWRFLKKVDSAHWGEVPLEAFVPWFVDDDTSPRGTWGQHVAGWRAARRGSEDFLAVRYEDLKADTVHELMKIAGFLGLSASEDECRRAVDLSSPGEMRRIEKEEEQDDPYLRNTRLDIPFVGPAVVGGWRSDMAESDAAIITARWAELMDELGYER